MVRVMLRVVLCIVLRVCTSACCMLSVDFCVLCVVCVEWCDVVVPCGGATKSKGSHRQSWKNNDNLGGVLFCWFLCFLVSKVRKS